MPVVTDLNFFTAQRHEPFDVKLVLLLDLRSLGLEYDDFAAFGQTEIVRDTVNENMIAGGFHEVHDEIAFAKMLLWKDARPLLKIVIRSEPKLIRLFCTVLVAYGDRLVVNENSKRFLRPNSDDFAVI